MKVHTSAQSSLSYPERSGRDNILSKIFQKAPISYFLIISHQLKNYKYCTFLTKVIVQMDYFGGK